MRLVKITVFQVYRFLQPWVSPCLQSLFLGEGKCELEAEGNRINASRINGAGSLAGCLGPDSNNGPATPSNPNQEPNDAYGLYAAVIDGYYGSSMGILSEWYDSLRRK